MNSDDCRGYGCCVAFVSVVAIIVSFVSLLIQDVWKDKFSSQTFIIAVLSALVTFLVAWQIWQTIDTKNEIKSIHKEYDARHKVIADYVRELEKWREDYMDEIDSEHSFVSGIHLFHKALWDETRIEETPTIVGNLYIQYLTALDFYISALEKGRIEMDEIINYLDAKLDIIDNSLQVNNNTENEIILNKTQLKQVASLFKSFETYFDKLYNTFKNAKLDADVFETISEMRVRRKKLCDMIANI